MDKELINQTLVAASVAKQSGFDNTYEALIELVRELERSTAGTSLFSQDSTVNLMPPKSTHENPFSLRLY